MVAVQCIPRISLDKVRTTLLVCSTIRFIILTELYLPLSSQTFAHILHFVLVGLTAFVCIVEYPPIWVHKTVTRLENDLI